MKSLIHQLNTLANRLSAQKNKGRTRRRSQKESLSFEELQPRALLAAVAIADGGWTDPATWQGGILPSSSMRAIISQGITVELDGTNHVAQELVIQGDLVVTDATQADKSLTTRWIHVNSGGEFLVGSLNDRYDQGTFSVTLTGTDVDSDHVIETSTGTMNVMNNDGFLMTAMGGSIEFYGQDKLSFTKLSATAEIGATTITVENIIERNYDQGAVDGSGEFVTSATDDGIVNWEINDQIVVASSSYDYTEEDVRTIAGIVDNGDGTSTLTLNEALAHRHYGEIETYGETTAPGTTAASQTYSIDLRAEVALLSRNVKVQGLSSQDTDIEFGDRANVDVDSGLNIESRFTDANGNPIDSKDVTEEQALAAGLSHEEAKALPSSRVSSGVGGHIMIMPTSGEIMVDGVQLDRMGQTSQKGRYPIHWHLGSDRAGDVLKNTSITNSNNRGVTIHGTQNLRVEGVVLHDVHGHGVFFEDAVETGNELVANIAFGIHKVGGNDNNFANPGGTDPFVVDTHDAVLETGSRFVSSAAFWITNPTNTFVGNISAGGAGTGFWYAIPRTVLGASSLNSDYDDIVPIFSELTQFDNNTSHSSPIGLNFDRGSDIEDATFADGGFDDGLRTNQRANIYSPRMGGLESGTKTTHTVNGFTNYKATGSAFYHRGEGNTITLNNLRVADSYNGPWAVSENLYDNNLFVGHSQGNADLDAEVGGPRLYDGAGLYTNSHFAGFADDDASTFQVEGSSFGPTMYHAFRGTSFENDGTYDHVAHAVSDFTDNPNGHNLGQPSQWIKAVIDLDGTLTGGVGGGVGFSIVPNVDFLVDAGDVQPAGWDAWLTDDIYARMRIQNNNDGEALFPKATGEPLIRFTADDGDFIDVMGGQDNGDLYWTQIAAKADSDGDGNVESTLTIEFGRNGLPENGFVLNMKNSDGERPALVPSIQAKVDAARLVSKFVGAGTYTPTNGTEVGSEAELRSATTGVVFFRDDSGNLFLNTSIVDQPLIELTPGAAQQTAFVSSKVEYGATIEAEAYDNGFAGLAFQDSDATNSLGSYRSDTGVDATEAKVGDIVDGEWLEYTTEIVGAAYEVGVNVSSTAAGGQIRILVANNNSAGFLRELGTVDVPDTGGTFETLTIAAVDLAPFAGTDSVIRLEFVGAFDSSVEVDSIQFDTPTQSSYVAREITADLTTTRIELEEFDVGGQGVAYYDDSPGNASSGDYRTDEDVDTNDNRLQGRVFDGEWLEYTTDIQAGEYDITLKKAWGGANNGVRLFIADSNSTLTFTELGVYDFQVGAEELLTLTKDLTPWAGTDRVIRIEIIGNWMGLDYLEFESLTQTAPTADIVDVTPDARNTSVGVVTINFDEDVNGVDINDMTLTLNGNPVDISGLTVTQISPRQYTIDLSTVTTTDGIYELNLNSSGSGIEDTAGNALETDAVDQFMIDMTGPQVEAVTVNDGSAQRSMVSEITVTFSEIVTGVDANSFILTNTTNSTQVVPTVSTQVINGKTVATLTFSGAGIIGSSLADGDYTLTTLDSLTDSVGNQLDGDSDGVSGGNATDDFFRFFGDINGDRSVNIADFFQFRNAFRGNYNAAFDFNGDGNINILDFFQFRSRFGQTL